MHKRALANLAAHEYVLFWKVLLLLTGPTHINLSFNSNGICSPKDILSRNVLLLLFQLIFVGIS